MNATERFIADHGIANRAIDEHPCPTCGADAGVRCRFLRPGTNPKRTTVDVRKNPCTERVALAWRAWLAEGPAS